MPDNIQDQLRAFYDRRHPAYNGLVEHWKFLKDTYRGGRDWFNSNVFRYYKEGDEEFKKRLERAFRFNHTKEVVELVQKYLFKADISRNESQAPEIVRTFWKRTTLSGLSISQMMRMSAAANSMSRAEARAKKFRIYAYVVPAEDILDYAWDEDGDGELLWVKLRERVRDDADPLTSSGDIVERQRLWTRKEWILFEDQEVQETTVTLGQSQMKRKIVEVKRGTHGLGFVPVRFHDHTIGEDPYRVPGLIDDIAYLDRAVANYLSNLDAIIQDQTFSQLAIPAQAVQQGDDLYTKILDMGTKRIFVYDAGQGSSAAPHYLSPDPKQAGVILAVINKIINEIYHTIGLAGERTKEDNAVGIDNSSGVAKAYDFERVNSLLLAKAQSCENVENWLVNTVLAWAGEKPVVEDLVTYPTTFDVMRLVDDLVTAEALAKIAAPIEVRRQQMRQTIDKLFPQLAIDLRKKLEASIDDWLEGTDVLLQPPTAFGGQKAAAAPSKQGSVTKNTPTTKAPASKATAA